MKRLFNEIKNKIRAENDFNEEEINQIEDDESIIISEDTRREN